MSNVPLLHPDTFSLQHSLMQIQSAELRSYGDMKDDKKSVGMQQTLKGGLFWTLYNELQKQISLGLTKKSRQKYQTRLSVKKNMCTSMAHLRNTFTSPKVSKWKTAVVRFTERETQRINSITLFVQKIWSVSNSVPPALSNDGWNVHWKKKILKF